MKKAYSKPDILFESFSLATSIAAGCEVKLLTAADGVCGVKWGKKDIFSSENTGCSSKIIDGDPKYDKLCYHNPYESNNVFIS